MLKVITAVIAETVLREKRESLRFERTTGKENKQ